MKTNKNLLEIRNLKTCFYTPDGILPAVDDISFNVSESEIVGIVGESGCGKSVTALSILRLIPNPPGKIVAGDILFRGQNLLTLNQKEIRGIRGNEISMIFQEPMSSLNPVFTIGNQITETIRLHQKVKKKEALEKAIELLRLVGIPSPEKKVNEFPHELSGGMKQRAMIAIALSCNPSLLIADEPTTALDVTIQAQILDLMLEMKEKFHMAILLITHDLGVVAETVQKVIVMYAGKIVEMSNVKKIFEKPRHPYTQGLLKSLPGINKNLSKKEKLPTIPGIVPSMIDLPAGCKFSPRCQFCFDKCEISEPPLNEIEKDHFSRCWLNY